MCDSAELYIAFATGTLLFVSEVLPLLKKYKSNGIVHALICILNSECMKNLEPDIDSDSDAVTSEEFNAVTIGDICMTNVHLDDDRHNISASSSGEFGSY